MAGSRSDRPDRDWNLTMRQDITVVVVVVVVVILTERGGVLQVKAVYLLPVVGLVAVRVRPPSSPSLSLLLLEH